MLDQGRYTWRHNSVLRIILDTLQDVSAPSWKIYCDLEGAAKIAGTTIPPDILPTQQRPDLVLINLATKSIVVFELTIPYDRNIDAAHNRKLDKYAGLKGDLGEQGYDVKLVCVEISSRGLISGKKKKIRVLSNPFSHSFLPKNIIINVQSLKC
jgi:hypothetical protein